MTLEQSVEIAAELGFDGVEIMGKRPHLSPLDYGLDECRRLSDLIKRQGVRVAAVAGYTDFGAGSHAAEVPFGEMQIAYVGELARRAAVLECNLVRVFTSYQTDGVGFPTQWRRTIDALRACCDRAAEAGVDVGVQNHHDVGVDTRAYVQLLAEVDRANLIPMYDCWSPYLRGEDAAAGAAQLGTRMRCTTVADYIVLPRWQYRPDAVNYSALQPPAALAVPMGEGELPYRAFLNALQIGRLRRVGVLRDVLADSRRRLARESEGVRQEVP